MYFVELKIIDHRKVRLMEIVLPVMLRCVRD